MVGAKRRLLALTRLTPCGYASYCGEADDQFDNRHRCVVKLAQSVGGLLSKIEEMPMT